METQKHTEKGTLVLSVIREMKQIEIQKVLAGAVCFILKK